MASASASGSYTTSAASAAGIDVVGTTLDRLGRQFVELLGDGNDVLVVGQDHDLIGVHRFDRGEQFGSRRVQCLSAGDHSLHAELPEQLGQARRRWQPQRPRR